MKNIFHTLLLITLCISLPAFADDDEILNPDDSMTEGQDKETVLKTQKKNSKKKKGQRNVKVQPNKEDDENIILELDGN